MFLIPFAGIAKRLRVPYLKPEVAKNIDEIIAIAYGIKIARGDLDNLVKSRGVVINTAAAPLLALWQSESAQGQRS